MHIQYPKYHINQDVIYGEFEYAYISEYFYNDNDCAYGQKKGWVYMVKFRRQNGAYGRKELHENMFSGSCSGKIVVNSFRP